MKNRVEYYATISFMLALFLQSCSFDNGNLLEVNVEKAMGRKVMYEDVCDRIELIPVTIPEPECETVKKMDVTDAGCVALAGNKLFAWTLMGEAVFSIVPEVHVIDISMDLNGNIDVLTSDSIIEYRFSDGTVGDVFGIEDDQMTYCSLAKREDNVIEVSGYSSECNYLCEYYIDSGEFHKCKDPYPVPAPVIDNSDWFRYNGKLMFFYSDSGNIWQSSMFFSPYLEWTFTNCDQEMSFVNAQMTDNNIFMDVFVEKEEHMLIFNRWNGHAAIVKQFKDGFSFPLGVILDDCNYVIVCIDELEKCVIPQLLDSNSIRIWNNRKNLSQNYMLVRYHLKETIL